MVSSLLKILLFSFSISLFAHEPPSTKSEIQNYIDNYLEIFEIESKYINTYSEKNIPAYKYAIKNTGDETITNLTVTVYFLDKNNKPFYETNDYPISEYANLKQLKPNYTYRMERQRYQTAKEISPKEWSEKIKLEIVDVVFKP